jgi:prephenate dehydrogenase
VLEKGGASVVETTPEKHDELMAVVQGLNHVNTIMMGMVLSKIAAPLSQLDLFTTPIFATKSKIVEKILTDNPLLHAEIICANPNMKRIIEIYEQTIGEIKTTILQKDAEEFTNLIHKAGACLWPPRTG